MFWIIFTSLAGIRGKLLAREKLLILLASGVVALPVAMIGRVTDETAGRDVLIGRCSSAIAELTHGRSGRQLSDEGTVPAQVRG